MTEPSSARGAALSAIFDTWPDADAARQRLLDAGVPSGDVRVIPESPEVQAEGHDVGTSGGFVGALFSMFFPRDDNDAYAEALRRGGVLVVAERVPAGLRDAAMAALDHEAAVDLDERAAAWATEGRAPLDDPTDAAPATLRRDPATGRRRVRSYVSD